MLAKLGLPEVGIILIVVLVVFGPTRLPQLGKAVGETLKEFKQAFRRSPDDQE